MIPINSISSSGLRAFPPEIREMIYNFSGVLSWAGKTPALIVALRGDQQIYHEVLDLFCKKNTFTLHQANMWKMGDMSISAIQTIQTLNVDFWSSADWEEWDTAQIIEPSTHDFDSHPIITSATSSISSSSSSLHTINFNMANMTEYTMSACLPLAMTCALHLPRLRRITVLLPRLSYHRQDDPYDASGCAADLVRGFNRGLGVQGRLLRVGTTDGELWFWEAEGGGGEGGDGRARWGGV